MEKKLEEYVVGKWEGECSHRPLRPLFLYTSQKLIIF